MRVELDHPCDDEVPDIVATGPYGSSYTVDISIGDNKVVLWVPKGVAGKVAAKLIQAGCDLAQKVVES